MENPKEKNSNLGNTQAKDTADQSNMPENQVPRHRSNENHAINGIQNDGGFLGRELGEGDFGSEEARSDPDKGNEGHAGNMPNSVPKDASEQ